MMTLSVSAMASVINLTKSLLSFNADRFKDCFFHHGDCTRSAFYDFGVLESFVLDVEDIWFPISIGNSMICSDIWPKYHE